MSVEHFDFNRELQLGFVCDCSLMERPRHVVSFPPTLYFGPASRPTLPALGLRHAPNVLGFTPPPPPSSRLT